MTSLLTFLTSKQLESLEDQGMSCLHAFPDLIDELQLPQAAYEEDAGLVAEIEPLVKSAVEDTKIMVVKSQTQILN